MTKSRVQLALCTQADIAKALKRYYGVGAETLDELAAEKRAGHRRDR